MKSTYQLYFSSHFLTAILPLLISSLPPFNYNSNLFMQPIYILPLCRHLLDRTIVACVTSAGSRSKGLGRGTCQLGLGLRVALIRESNRAKSAVDRGT